MCDYSLEMYGSRPAREGELYTTTRFPSGSIGFASAGDPRTAVCMQCDTKVMLTDIPAALQTALRVGAEAETTFAQRETGLYRDGLRLADGRFVSLHDLQPVVGAYIPTLLEREGAKRVRAAESFDDALSAFPDAELAARLRAHASDDGAKVRQLTFRRYPPRT